MNKIADVQSRDVAPGASTGRSPYFSEEHELLRAQVRRFVETEIKPKALAWEDQGYVPREVLRRMGSLGFLGIRYPARYGGSEMDTLATVILAEELGRSTFSGVAITALVHTDMASVHLLQCRQRGAEGQMDAAHHFRRGHHRRCRHRAGRGLRREGHPALSRGAMATVMSSTARKCSSPTASMPISIVWRPRPIDRDRRADRLRCSWSRRGRPGFTVSRTLDKHGWRSSDTAELHFDGCRIPAENRLGEEGCGFYAILKNFQNERTTIGAMAIGRGAGRA